MMSNGDLISRSSLMQVLEGKLYENQLQMPCDWFNFIRRMPAVDAEPVKHGRWVLTPHKESCNYRWNVTAHCSECKYDAGEIWAGFFPGVPDGIAKIVAEDCGKSAKPSNYCPHCGAKMDLEGE